MSTVSTTIPGPAITCPSWCDLPESLHSVNLKNGRAGVVHDGPNFGRFLYGGGTTFAETDDPAELRVILVVAVPRQQFADLGPEELRALAADALAAAEWLEAQA